MENFLLPFFILAFLSTVIRKQLYLMMIGGFTAGVLSGLKLQDLMIQNGEVLIFLTTGALKIFPGTQSPFDKDAIGQGQQDSQPVVQAGTVKLLLFLRRKR